MFGSNRIKHRNTKMRLILLAVPVLKNFPDFRILINNNLLIPRHIVLLKIDFNKFKRNLFYFCLRFINDIPRVVQKLHHAKIAFFHCTPCFSCNSGLKSSLVLPSSLVHINIMFTLPESFSRSICKNNKTFLPVTKKQKQSPR